MGKNDNTDKVVVQNLQIDIYYLILSIRKDNYNVIKLVKRLEGYEENEKIILDGKPFDSIELEERFCVSYFIYLLTKYLSGKKHVGVVIEELMLTQQYRNLSPKKRRTLCMERINSGKLSFGYDYSVYPFDLDYSSFSQTHYRHCRTLAKKIVMPLISNNRLGLIDMVQADSETLLDMIDYDADITWANTTDDSKFVAGPDSEKKDVQEKVSEEPHQKSAFLRNMIAILAFAVTMAVAVFLFYQEIEQNPMEMETTFESSQSIAFGSRSMESALIHDLSVLKAEEDEFQEIKRVAESGDAESQMIVGITYFLDHDFVEAEKWLLRSANQGYAPSQGLLCYLYYSSIPDREKTYSWAQLAMKNHDALGYYFLGRCYHEGIEVKQDYKQAASLYQAVINGEDSAAGTVLEPFASYGEITAKPMAEGALGTLYLNGKGVNKSAGAALDLFFSAYNGGYFPAAAEIGNMYYRGIGLDQDIEKAFLWFQKGADNGDPTSQVMLGSFYETGEGNVEQDYNKALEYYNKAAKQDDPAAKCFLAHLYIDGPDEIRDFNHGMALLRESANQGFEPARQILESKSLKPAV